LADIDMDNFTIAVARAKESRSGVQSLDRHRATLAYHRLMMRHA
jgi:hypothetical protein